MRTEYFITMDTHCRTTDVCIKTRRGKLVSREHLQTGIPQLLEVIESVPRPRYLAFEEGALAGWLYRSLKDSADETIVCEPRRNAHIAKGGDKDDAIDAEKLNDLYRGGFLKPVHQLDQAQKAVTKQVIAAYHDRVAHRVAEKLKLLALCRRWGVGLSGSTLLDGREALLKRLQAAGVPEGIRTICGDRFDGLEDAMKQENALHKEVCRIARQDRVMSRVARIPGYGPIRAATLIAYLDTPWRFKSKSALWKYVGIGLRRETSGSGPEYVCVEQACSRILRNVTIGAAETVLKAEKQNIFSTRYRRWLRSGMSPRNARRNVARDQVSAIWGMWKSDKEFDETMLAEKSQS